MAKREKNKNKVKPSETPQDGAGTENLPVEMSSGSSGSSGSSRTEIVDPSTGFPIVGIGASAGGLSAFEAFFSGMPVESEPGMAFVLVQHLAPDYKSILTNLVQRCTRMEVFEVEDGMRVRPNCIYIIPPNRDMAFIDSTLQLLAPTAPRGQRLPIDFFFKSLALDQRERAICVVLSGTGCDGTQGIRAVKAEGGMVMAQRPDSCEYSGMPYSAISTGLVDYELAPADMPAQIIAYVTHAFGKLSRRPIQPPSNIENMLKKIFILLRSHTGHDFSQYKPSTINRRIERRMAVQQIEDMEGYVKFLQKTQVEVETLFRDLLIGVTGFFRDPEAFSSLEEEIIPRLFAGKPASATIRVWSPGCSTGEEAYTLAILLAEHQDRLKQSFKIQVFATDIDSQAITVARAGRYPASIAADITPERLTRFFLPEPDGSTYRIHKTIRDMVIFSEQDVIKDPPFSRLDLISCRNLMIYMGTELQKKIIPLFHYALNPGCYLFLGTSETIGPFDDLFTVINRKSKIYCRKTDYLNIKRLTLGGFIPSTGPKDEPAPAVNPKTDIQGKTNLRTLTEQAILNQDGYTAILVNDHGDILYIHGRTGLYLEPAPGEASVVNILKMARDGLRNELVLALRKATVMRDIIRCPEILVKTNGDYTRVNLTVSPVSGDDQAFPDTTLFLVQLEQPPVSDIASAHTVAIEGSTGTDADGRIFALTEELKAHEEYLQAANEELETANEELKSSNEEMQSVNEELQSTNEELETSKEELQSINEELATVNSELQTKVIELTKANNDMNNLLAGTGAATLFVDHQLRIVRFTPMTTELINLISVDIGRPVGHIVSNLVGYDRLVEDTQAVLNDLAPREVEVQSRSGAWFLMRIRPYRTLDNVIEGAVIAFTNITDLRSTRESARNARIFAENIVDTVHEPLIVLEQSYHVVSANHAFYKTFQLSPADTLGRLLFELNNHQWDVPALRTLLEENLEKNILCMENNVMIGNEKTGFKDILINARRLEPMDGRSALILLAIGNVTHH